MNGLEGEKSQALPASAGALGHRYGAISVTNDPPVVVQAKLKLGPANDKFEQEAERVAGRVAGSLTAADGGDSRRPATGGALWEKPAIQHVSADATAANLPTVDLWTASAIEQARGGGRPLSTGVRAPIEKALGTDFSGVRVHTDANANRLNCTLDARAFTVGRDIFFGAREFDPSGSSGRRLLAHELTHVAQQSESGQFVQTSKKRLPKDADRGKVEKISENFREGLIKWAYRKVIDRYGKDREWLQIPRWLREKIEKQKWYKNWKKYNNGIDQAIPYKAVLDVKAMIESPPGSFSQTPSSTLIRSNAKKHPQTYVGGFSVPTWQSWHDNAVANLATLDELIKRSKPSKKARGRKAPSPGPASESSESSSGSSSSGYSYGYSSSE